MSSRHIWAVTRKEIHHIFRDRSTLFLVLATPTLMLLLWAYAFTVDIQHVAIAVLDYDRSQTSRDFVQQVTAGQDLDLHAQVNSEVEIEEMLMKGEIKAALIIDPTFSSKLLTLKGMPMQIIIDGTEPESGAFAVDHIAWRAEEFINQALESEILSMGFSAEALNPIDLRVRTWYNPSLKPRNDLIPGLISMVLGFPALSVALTLAREREHGTLEQLLATPIGRGELLISAIFLFAILSMGIVIGVFMRTQATAMALSFLLIFFPGFFLTGIFFPIAAMPEIMRLEAMFLPGTHYAIITRGVFLTGIGINILWANAVMLLILGFAFTGLAALFFRKKLG